MVSYRIDIKTGDVRGAGTDANIFIVLHGKGNQTDQFHIDNPKKNDFERNKLDSFTVESPLNIPEVQRIEFWRDNKGRGASWYVDYIEVTNLATGITSIFPVMRWIKEHQRYTISHIDTCLPQNDPFKQQRALELKLIQQTYELQVKIPGLPAQVKELPDDEKFSFDYLFNIQYKTKTFSEESQKQVMANGIQWKSMEDVKSVYVAPFAVPRGLSNYNDDVSFGQQRIASLNSTLITLCKSIPDKLGITSEQIAPFLEGKSVQKALDKNRLFIVDLEILEGIPTKTQELVIPAPIALFYFTDAGKLMPIAIQLYQQKGTGNPVFFPCDPPNTWLLAKMWYNLADAHYHQALTHLNLTHFMMEGICVATKRQLSHSHPILRLLNPHFLYLLAINYLGLGTLVNPGGYFDKTSNGGINGAFFLMRKSMAFWRLDVHGTLPENLKQRQVFDPSVLKGAYDFRDDAMLLYDAINDYVTKYVNHYYASEESFSADYEIQAWGAEIVKSRDEGGVGILGVPNNGKFETCNQLIQTLTPIIYTCSVAHAAANFQQYDEYGAPFNYPFILYGEPPRDKSPVTEETLLKAIGNRVDILALMSITSVLSEKATQSLGDFEKQLIVDPPAVAIVEEFRKQLRKVEKIIDDRNTKRDIPYDYLQPSTIPNAISI